MPRLQAVPAPVALVQRLTELHAQVLGAHRAALDYARQAGEVLRTVPPEERAALAAAAGITGRRTRFVYAQIAERWDAVQHAASIREALKIISGLAPVDTRQLRLPFDSGEPGRTIAGKGYCVVCSPEGEPPWPWFWAPEQRRFREHPWTAFHCVGCGAALCLSGAHPACPSGCS